MAVKDWSTTAADNDDADANINWLEGQAPSTVNGSARAMMAALRANYTINVSDYIPPGTVATADVSSYVQEAFDDARLLNNPTIESGPGVFLIGATVTCDFPCTIDMQGTFRPHGTFADFLFSFDGRVPGNEDTNTDNLGFDSYWRDRLTFKQPLRIDGYKSDGSARQSKAVKFKQIDHGILNIDVRWCIEQAIHITGCRECDIYGRILRSGGMDTTTTNAPLYIFDENGIDDANNNLRFWGLNISYPNGSIMYIGKNAGASGTPRRIEFHGCQMHYLDSTISGSTYAYQDVTLQNGVGIDIALANDVKFFGGNLRKGTSSTGALFKLGDTSGGTAVDRIKFIAADLSGDANNAAMQLFDLQNVTTRIALIDTQLTVTGSGLKFSAGSDLAKVYTLIDTGDLELNGADVVVRVLPDTSSDPVFVGSVNTDAQRRFVIDATGLLNWGSGSAARNVNLKRQADDLLYTDDQFQAADGLVTKIIAGIPVDGNFTVVQNGIIAIDSANLRVYFRIAGAWRYAQLT